MAVIGGTVNTDAFVVYGVGIDSDETYMVPSAFGYRNFTREQISYMWDGWATVIRPAGLAGDHGVEHRDGA